MLKITEFHPRVKIWWTTSDHQRSTLGTWQSGSRLLLELFSLRTCIKVQEERGRDGNIQAFPTPPELPTAPYRLSALSELSSPRLLPCWLSSGLQASLLRVFYCLLFLCSPRELCCAQLCWGQLNRLSSALFSFPSTMSPWEKPPTFIYVMPRPK